MEAALPQNMGRYLRTDEVIDLELFVAEDEVESEEYKSNRDFEFYSQASEFEKAEDINLLSFWIEKMRGLSGKLSVGKFSQMIYVLFALGIIALGTLGAYTLVSATLQGDTISVKTAFFCIVISWVFIVSLLFLPLFAKILNWKIAFLTNLILGARANLPLAENKNKNFFKARAKFLGQLFGFSFVLSMFFTSYFNFAKSDYKFQYLEEGNFSQAEICNIAKVVALPWSFTLGEGLLYPSVDDVKLASNERENIDANTQGVWENFWLAGIFVYGLLPRLVVFFVCFFKGRNGFGEHKISNDGKLNVLLNRMRLSSSNKDNWQGLKNDKDCRNLLLLRSDIVAYSEVIKQRAVKQTNFDKFNVFEYNFLSELFTDEFNDMQCDYSNFTIAFLSDDYNDEVFENMQNLINTYPEKTLNVLLLGRYDKEGKSFDELVAVEKSWWQRKLNAISTQNINIC